MRIKLSELERKKTTEIVDEIVDSLKRSPVLPEGLCLANNALHNRTTEELIQIFQAIPPYIMSLNLEHNDFGRKTAAELVAIFKAIPATIERLYLSDNNLDSKTVAELMQILASLSMPDVQLRDVFKKSNEEISLILAALPEVQRTLDLTGIMTYTTYTIDWSGEQPRIVHILNAIPKQITTLLLSSNKLDKKTLPELVQIFAAIPAHVTTLSLEDNNLGSKSCAELIQILCMIPIHIRDLSLYNNNLNLKTHSYKELLQIFSAFPEGIKKLDLNGNHASITPTRLLKLIKTIPISISKIDWEYYCPYGNVGEITAALLPISAETTELCLKKLLYRTKTAEIIKIFKEIPPQITTLDLSENDFCNKTASDLIAIFKAIPTQITNLNLHGLRLFMNKTKQEVEQIIAAIPPQVTTLDLSDIYFPASVNGFGLLPIFSAKITNLIMRDRFYGKTAADFIKILEADALELSNFTLVQQVLRKQTFYDFHAKIGCISIQDYKVLEVIDANVQVEEIVFSSASYAEFIDKLELFLIDRWDRIKETELAYPKTALNDEMTALCLKIAGLIARHKKQEKNIYQYLMPTIKECYDPVTDLSLSSLTLNQFVLDEQHEYGFNLETLYMHHSYAQGDSQAMAATLINPYIPHAEGESGIAISDQTFLNMIYHSKESLAYHRAYEAWFNAGEGNEKQLLGPALQTLMKGLKRGSVQGTGSEFIPGIEALDAIAEFYTFFGTLTEQTQRTLLSLETGQKTFNHSTDRHEPEIFEHIWRILMQEDQKGLGCVNILSDKIALILAQPKYQESLFGLKRKTLHNLFEKSAQIFQESYRISKFDMNRTELPIPIALFFNLIIKNHKNILPERVITMLRNLNIPAGSVYPTNTLVQHLITKFKGNSKLDLVKETQVFCNQTSGISTIGFFGFKTDTSEDNTALLENQNKR